MVFCFVLCKLSYPHWLFEPVDYFGYSPSYLSYIANNLIKYLVERYNTLLEWHPSLTYERMKEYAKVCKQLGGLRGKSAIWAFVDSTFRAFCWPKDKQQLVYSKYRRSHGMEWFVGVVPDGLNGFPYGSYEEKVNDIRILKESGLQRCLRQLFFSQGRWPLYLFGDKAYKSQRFIMAPYVGVRSGWRKKFNKKMSSLQTGCEKAFEITQTLWLANALKCQLKSGLMPVANLYKLSVLLTNCYTCLRGNQISSRFCINLPLLHQYLLSESSVSDTSNQ